MSPNRSQALQPREPAENTTAIHERAEANLLYIRDAIALSDSFTAVPGWGMLAMGTIAVVGSWIAPRSTAVDGWINTWTAVAILACSVGMIAMAIKAYVRKIPIWAGSGRRFLVSFAPAIFAGCILTEIFYQNRLDNLMPPMWLMLYGVAIMNGGAYSVKPVPITGLAFFILGVAAAFYPLDRQLWFEGSRLAANPWLEGYLLRDAVLAAGFGGFHLVLGAIVAARHGG